MEIVPTREMTKTSDNTEKLILRSQPETDVFKVLFYSAWIVMGLIMCSVLLFGTITSNRNYSLLLVLIPFLLISRLLVRIIHWQWKGQEDFITSDEFVILRYNLLFKITEIKIPKSEVRTIRFAEAGVLHSGVFNLAFYAHGNFLIQITDGREYRFGQSRKEKDFRYYMQNLHEAIFT